MGLDDLGATCDFIHPIIIKNIYDLWVGILMIFKIILKLYTVGWG